MARPKVSIVVPVWNVERYLDRCIKSLVCQTLKEIEIILVDDKSTDNSPQICDLWNLKDDRIKVIHKGINQGLGEARNSGLDVANGEYVAFVDSDDFVEKETYQTLSELASLNALDAVYTEFNIDHNPNYRITPYPSKRLIGRVETDQLILDLIGALPSYKSDVVFQYSSCKVLYSNKIISSNLLRFHSERQCVSEDLIWNIQFLNAASRVEITNYKFYHYCLNGKSLTHTYKPKLWKKYENLVGLIKENTIELQKYQDFWIRLQRTMLFNVRACIMQEIKSRKVKVEKKRIIEELVNNKSVRDICQNYPGYKLPLKHRVFFYLVKFRQVDILLYLLK